MVGVTLMFEKVVKLMILARVLKTEKDF